MRAGLSGKYKQYIVVAIHIVLSFLWEKAVFRNVGINPSGTIALSNAISDKAELIITYLLTHLFAAVMIFYLWKLLFHLFSGFKKEYIVFLALFSAGALFIFICWPEVLTGSAGFDDNLVTYSCGV